MSRYIDADKLLEKLSRMIDYCKKDNKISGLTVLFQVGDAIIDCSTAAVREEKHGKWIDESTRHRFYVDTYSCSLCGHTFVFDNDETPEELEYNYCPKCGAKMDGDKK